jgi:hypothetical protein
MAWDVFCMLLLAHVNLHLSELRPQLVSLLPDNEHRLARMKIEKISACVFKDCIQILMIAHNMAFATRDRPLPSRQCGRALSSVEMGFAI